MYALLGDLKRYVDSHYVEGAPEYDEHNKVIIIDYLSMVGTLYGHTKRTCPSFSNMGTLPSGLNLTNQSGLYLRFTLITSVL